MLEADITGGRLIHHLDGEEELLLQAEPGKHVENEIAHFVDCVESGRQPLTDGPGSLQGLRVIWRLYEAENQGTVADLRGLGLDQFER
jgi:predicted dehydrogenase